MNIFNTIQLTKPKYNRFNLSHEVKLTFDFGQLIPIYIEPTLPGDKFRIKSEFLMRTSALIAPVMHRINVFRYDFFVPSRLTYDDWREFITGGEDGTSSPVYPRYTLTASQANTYMRPGTLLDYLGFPVQDSTYTFTADVTIDAMPIRVYTLIYNEYFRDQNLEEEIPFNHGGGIRYLTDAECAQLFTIKRKAWQKDYFTSALPFAQRGESVKIPVVGDVAIRETAAASNGTMVDVSGTSTSGNLKWIGAGSSSPADGVLRDSNNNTVNISPLNFKGAIESISSTLNDLRAATRLQQWLERNAVGGSRYIEQIFAHFGVKSSDARLQRPEYLGGSKSPVVISEVLQTSSTDTTSPQGNQSGHAISIAKNSTTKKYCEEHGYIMSFVCCVPKPAYYQGMPRKFTKFDKFDYYFPEFAHLGEQAIMKQELFWSPTSTDNNGTWGYTPRYAEYRFNNDRICGDFRTTLDFYHLARKFGSLPTLSKEFVQVRAYESDLNRIFAVEDNQRYNFNQLWMQIYLSVDAKRLIPRFATPTL